MSSACSKNELPLNVEVIETSANGNKLTLMTGFSKSEDATLIKLFPAKEKQTITGFGGSFTESSAYLLNKIGKENRKKIIDAYFGPNGAKYSCLLYTSPSPRDKRQSRMPSSA